MKKIYTLTIDRSINVSIFSHFKYSKYILDYSSQVYFLLHCFGKRIIHVKLVVFIDSLNAQQSVLNWLI